MTRQREETIMRNRAKILAGIAAVGCTLALTAGPASANTGNVSAAEDCQTWHASVSLSHNVTADRAVDVVSTIPGAPGFTNHHYNSTFGEIWTANGTSPKQGTVTLNIYFPNGQLEFTDHKTLTEAEGCETTTTQSLPTSSASTSTSAEAPSSVSSLPSSAPTSICTQPRGCCVSECNGSNANAGELPRTGSRSLPFAFAGLTSFGAGVALLISFRRQTR